MREKSAGAMIYRKEGKAVRYLVLHYGAGHWDYVKGHVEPDEEEEETVMREAKEETGIVDLNLVPGFKERISYVYTTREKKVAKDVVYFLAEARTGDVKLSREHTEFRWEKFSEAVKLVTHKTSRDVLKKADKFVRKHASQETLRDSDVF